jgi:hypothetical protein
MKRLQHHHTKKQVKGTAHARVSARDTMKVEGRECWPAIRAREDGAVAAAAARQRDVDAREQRESWETTLLWIYILAALHVARRVSVRACGCLDGVCGSALMRACVNCARAGFYVCFA